jgi:hypothetical protein
MEEHPNVNIANEGEEECDPKLPRRLWVAPFYLMRFRGFAAKILAHPNPKFHL